MRKLLTSALAAALVCTLSVNAQQQQQQQQQQGKRRTGQLNQPGENVMHAEAEAVELMLLRQKSVREELKIDQDAAKKIFEFTHKQQEAATETHKLPRDQQTSKWESMTKENEEFLRTAITPEQHKRLKQIALQTAGILFITSPKIAQELNLTPQQEEQAKRLQQEVQDKVREVLHANASNREARDEKLAEMRKANHEELVKLLTDEQRTKFKEMVGEPFKGKLIYEEPDKDK
jgi:NADH dehydrogenase/NADH:ubiquinone oxidoreductase subunit G